MDSPQKHPPPIAIQLRKIADRQEALDVRKAANEEERRRIEDEDRKIHRLLSSLTNQLPDQPEGAQLQTIVGVISEGGKLLRPEIFERLKPTGKAPASLKQLSSLLTRLKHSGHIGFDEDHRWFVKPRNS